MGRKRGNGKGSSLDFNNIGHNLEINVCIYVIINHKESKRFLLFLKMLLQIVCRELGLHYAQTGTQTDMFNPPFSDDDVNRSENITSVLTDTNVVFEFDSISKLYFLKKIIIIRLFH